MRRTSILGLFVCASVIAGGCSDQSPTRESAPANIATPATATAGTGRSACELITNQEASIIVGSPVLQSEKSRGPSSSSCFFAPGPGAYVLEGDVLLEFNNLLTLRDARAKWEKLAKTALSRL